MPVAHGEGVKCSQCMQMVPADRHVLVVIQCKDMDEHLMSLACTGDVSNWYRLLPSMHVAVHVSPWQLYHLTRLPAD